MKKVDTMGMEREGSSAPTKRVKRRHSAEFKARVVEECEARGASVAGVALAHGVNANLVRKWIIKKRCALVPAGSTGLLPVRIMTGVASRSATPKRSDDRRDGEAIEVDFSGARIRVRGDFDTGALRDVVRVLRDTLLR